MVSIILVVLVCIVVYVAWEIYKFLFPPGTSAVANVPGPPTKLLFGSMHLFKGSTNAEFTAFLIEQFDKYGSPCRLHFGPKPFITIFKAQDMEAVMKSSTNIRKSTDYAFVQDWLGLGLLLSDGEKWHSRRKMLTPAFHFQILRDFMPIFNEQALVLISIMKKRAERENPVEVNNLVTMCTLDIICETAMGKQLNSQTSERPSEYLDSLNKFSDFMQLRFRDALLQNELMFQLSSTGRKANHHLQIMHDFTKSVIKERQQNKNQSSSPEEGGLKGTKRKRMAFLDLLLDLKANGQMNDEDIREEVDTFMFEGHDTTSTGLAWALWSIAAHPDVQEKLYHEIVEVCGENTEEEITSEQLSNLKYLDIVLKESQRVLPSVPQIGRTLVEPVVFDDKYTIPAGTLVNMSIMALHRDPEWFPEPLVFDPERFLPENSVHRHPFAFVPFSAGPRNCIGQKFALMEEKVIVTHIVRSFKLEATQSFDELQPALEFVLRPSKGIWLRLTQRS